MLERTFKTFDFNLVNNRVMIYNGQLDVIIAWPLTENFITTLNWSANHNYTGTIRTQWHVGDDLAGYVKQVIFSFIYFLHFLNFQVLFSLKKVGDFTQVLATKAEAEFSKSSAFSRPLICIFSSFLTFSCLFFIQKRLEISLKSWSEMLDTWFHMTNPNGHLI